MSNRAAIAVFVSSAMLLAAVPALAASGDAQIDFALGLAAAEKDDTDEAYKRFKAACMAEDGLADACLRWAALAAAKDNKKDVKRALGSAVMLDPEDITARYELALMLLAKKDWVWATEHLTAAIDHAKTDQDRAVLRYTLGYAKLKAGETDAAAKQFALAGRHLPPELEQRATYFRALIAREAGKHTKAAALMERATTGPDAIVADAAAAQLASWTAFPRHDGFAGQISASLGINTHPSAAFLDDPSSVAETDPTLQSVFRGDVILGAGGYEHGLHALFTVYREQNWTELGDSGGSPSAFDIHDMNITLFMLQPAYVFRTRGSLEHEIRIGVDSELQFLDHAPERDGDEGEWYPSQDAFGLFGWALGGKLWWSMAADPSSIWSVRIKVEGRPNQIEADRSTVRTRLRLAHNRYFLERKLQLKLLAGGRYDRSYNDPAVIKYDRLMPEGWIDLKWKTPWPRLSALVGAKIKYNWYLNSTQNEENSFRPEFISVDGFTDEQNAGFETNYYDLARHDFEWEVGAEVAVKAWWKATIALTYKHHQRLSNLDEAPVPKNPDTGERVPAREYGYTKDVVMLELRQGF
jgi:Tfp pilus assembly protein PilF